MSQSLNPARTSFAPTTARGPRIGGVVAALLLHALIVGVTLFTWQHKLELIDESPPSVPVDLVTIADKTNVTPTIDRTQKPAPQDEVKDTPDVPTPTPAPTPPPAAEAAPPPLPAPTITPKPAPAPTPDVKPQTKPVTPDTQKKPKTDDFAALLNNLTAPRATPRNAHTADRNQRGAGAMNAMTMDLIDGLKNQIQPCWSPPVGAPHPERLIPTFRMLLNQDGSVAQPPQLSAESAMQAAADPFMRAAAEAARRAIMTCGPYKLPADKYSTWRDITIDFDPRKIVQ